MIAITFALRAESSTFTAELRTAKIDTEIAVVHTGVGQKACQAAIGAFLRDARPDFLISSGFAGGVRDDLRSGNLILGENFSDRQLLAKAQQILGANIEPVKILTTKTIVDETAERSGASREFGAAAVDMETEFIASECAKREVRMLSLRVISDSVREPLPLPSTVLFDLAKQKTDSVKLTSYLLKHPTAIARLARFSIQIRKARNNLARALIALLLDNSLGNEA
jgi:adenosylhomocysteine nucleosidase